MERQRTVGRRGKAWALGALLTGLVAASVQADVLPDNALEPHPLQRRLVVGGDHAFPPYESLDATGHPVGFNVDLLRALGETLGFQPVFRLSAWAKARQDIDAGRIHVLPMYRSEPRSQTVDFTRPFTLVYYELISRRGTPSVDSLEELKGHSVIVQQGALSHDFLASQELDLELIPIESEPQVLRLLASGHHDYAMVTQFVGRHQTSDYQLSNLTSAGPLLLPVEYALAVTKGNTALLDELNLGLELLKSSGRLDALFDEWFGGFGDNRLSSTDLLRGLAWILIPLALITVGALTWSWTLKQQVALRTRDLRRELGARQRMEQRLRQTATVFDNTIEGVIVTDAKGDIVTVNPAFVEITGYTEAEVLGRNPRFLQSGRHEQQFYITLWSALETVGRWQGEVWNRRKNGEVYPQWLTISVVRDKGEIVNYVAVFSDLSQIKESQRLLDQLVHFDPLTNLPNRLLFEARLRHAITQCQRSGGHLGVLFLDLDQFKNVNDTLGHAMGDKLLRAAARRLSRALRQQDTVARLGGDEFAVVLENLSRPRDAALVAQKIHTEFARPFELDKGGAFITASVGIGLYPDDGNAAQDLLRNAETAMYQAKELGRNHYAFYTRELTEQAIERFTLENHLRYALERDELVLYYQLQLSLDEFNDARIVGGEALVRWRHSELGLVQPSRFIPLAEETGMIVAIGRWVLNAACAQAKSWQDQGLPPVRISVNLSGRQILRDDIVDTVSQALKSTGLAPQFLELEITESSMMAHTQKAMTNLQALKSLGVSLAIDDFGTGYSSMSYLKRFAVDRLKIDRSFVRDIPMDSHDEAITRAIIAMGHNLQLSVVAEGVETSAQHSFLALHGCDEMQGYLFSPPVPAEEFAALLASGTVYKVLEAGSAPPANRP